MLVKLPATPGRSGNLFYKEINLYSKPFELPASVFFAFGHSRYIRLQVQPLPFLDSSCKKGLFTSQPANVWLWSAPFKLIASDRAGTKKRGRAILSKEVFGQSYSFKTSSATSPFLDSSCKKDCSQANQPMFGFGQHPILSNHPNSCSKRSLTMRYFQAFSGIAI